MDIANIKWVKRAPNVGEALAFEDATASRLAADRIRGRVDLIALRALPGQFTKDELLLLSVDDFSALSDACLEQLDRCCKVDLYAEDAKEVASREEMFDILRDVLKRQEP